MNSSHVTPDFILSSLLAKEKDGIFLKALIEDLSKTKLAEFEVLECKSYYDNTDDERKSVAELKVRMNGDPVIFRISV